MDGQSFDAKSVRDLLDYEGCTNAMREVMAALSADPGNQPPRTITDLGAMKLFGLMPGRLPGSTYFGAKLVSVFPDPGHAGRSVHRGAVTLFDGETGEIACTADAEPLTQIRTACASAVATDVLARSDASRLAIFGCGAQAYSHVLAISGVRRLSHVGIWGRNPDVASRLAARLAAETGLDVSATPDPAALARDADIICTVTSSQEPILLGEWVGPGAHVNAVGSSYAGPVEVDGPLVFKSRYFVDYRPSALLAAAEFIVAKASGLIDDDHIVAEIGNVLRGLSPGRTAASDITFYKSLGHVAQDLSAARYILARSANSGD